MPQDKTFKLEKYSGKWVNVRYNVATDPSKPSVIFCGYLRVGKYYYSIESGANMIAFDDQNIKKVWDEETPKIDL